MQGGDGRGTRCYYSQLVIISRNKYRIGHRLIIVCLLLVLLKKKLHAVVALGQNSYCRGTHALTIEVEGRKSP